MGVISKKEVVALKGHVRIRAWKKLKNGGEEMVHDHTIKNLIVNVGKDSILKHIGGPTIACCTDSGFAEKIGVGDSSAPAALGDTDLVAVCNKLWKTISTTDKVYVRPTLFLSVDFGYTCANFTWNELGLGDSNGDPPTGALWARQTDCTPLAKDGTKRAIVEWQLSL